MRELKSVRVTTLVDNDVWEAGLASTWGLSLFVEVFMENERHVVLMDTSGSSNALFGNARKLGIYLSTVESIFISHWHGDHCGSLDHVLPSLRRSTPVYVPSKNLFEFERIMTLGGAPEVCSGPIEFMEGIMSTGEIGWGVSEHSLLMNVEGRGLVVLTGCGHPGVVRIVKRAEQVSGTNIYAVVGGFHISSMREGVSEAKALREMGVRLISPCHCTGLNAEIGIAKVMKEGYIKNGSGKVISIGP